MRKLIVVDTETGGLDPAEHSLLRFAAVIYQDGSVLGTFERGVREPTFSTTPEALKLNGITAEQVATWPDPWAVVYDFKNWLLRNELYGQQTLVAHNAAFDSSFLKRLWKMAGATWSDNWNYRMLCTHTGALLLEQAGRIVLPGGSASLDNVAKVFGASRSSETHNALEDALLCAHTLEKMLDMIAK